MKKIIHLFLLILAINLLGTNTATAKKQGQERIDSLLTILPKAKDDTNKVKLLNDLSITYSSINPDVGIKYGHQALELATKINWKKGMAAANNVMGINCDYLSDYRKALVYYTKAVEIYNEIGNKQKVAVVLGNIGIVYEYLSDYPTSLKYHFIALEANIKLGNKEGIRMNYGNIGNVYNSMGNYPKALESYFKSLKIAEEMGDAYGMANNYGNIAIVYQNLSDFPNAITYHIKALKIFEELGDKNGIAGRLNDIGSVYQKQNDNSKALGYYLEALKINKETGNKYYESVNLMNIGIVYEAQHNYSEALECNAKALVISKLIGNINGVAQNYLGLGGIYQAIGKDSTQKELKTLFAGNKTVAFKKAVIYYDSAVTIFKVIGNLQGLMTLYYNVSSSYEMLGDYKKAFANFKNYVTTKDTIYNDANNKKITALEKKRTEELNQKQLEIKDLQISKAKNQKWYFISGIFFLICLLLLLYNRYYIKTKANIIITREKKRSDDLLLNILPSEVAEELKDKGSAEAQLIDQVTVLFTDFKGFTAYSEKRSPQELVRDIHECFSAFDQIMEKNGMEKIKTIGDSYMAAGGLPTPNNTHASDAVKAALEIRQFIEEGKSRKIAMGAPYFEIRIGIHTGPVVAGIVGVKKFAYDIWGDTVNTASRMESSGEAGKVNISGSTYELVKDTFACTYRGKIEAKSKGMIDMYFAESIL